MVMKATPPAPLEVIEPQLILEFLIIALDAPAQFGEAHELGDRRRRRQSREPILRGLGGAARPLDQQPDRKSTRLNSSHVRSSYAVFCLKKKTRKSPILLEITRTFPIFMFTRDTR